MTEAEILQSKIDHWHDLNDIKWDVAMNTPSRVAIRWRWRKGGEMTQEPYDCARKKWLHLERR
jgi:hypothetical protein